MSHHESEYNKGGLVAFIFAFAFVFLFFIYIAFVHKGVILDKNETKKTDDAPAAASATPAAPTFDLAAVKEPWIETPEMIAAGANVFANACAMCHGDKGMGDGVAGKSLNPPPRNFVEAHWKVGGSRVKLFMTITNGLPGTSMAAFGHLPDNDRWALVHFVRSLGKSKVTGDDEELKKFLAEKK